MAKVLKKKKQTKFEQISLKSQNFLKDFLSQKYEKHLFVIGANYKQKR